LREDAIRKDFNFKRILIDGIMSAIEEPAVKSPGYE